MTTAFLQYDENVNHKSKTHVWATTFIPTDPQAWWIILEYITTNAEVQKAFI